MTRFALRGLLGRKLRTALTALAIVLGVAMISGTYILTDTINNGFNTIVTNSYKNADVVISGEAARERLHVVTAALEAVDGCAATPFSAHRGRRPTLNRVRHAVVRG